MGALSLGFGAIVPRVETGIVSGALDFNPVGAVDTAWFGDDRADRKGARGLDPAPLFLGDDPDFVSDFREVLVLTEDQGDIVFLTVSETDDVQGQADVHALFAHV